jgi:hypothetical protein
MRILVCVEPLKENISSLSHLRDVGSLHLLYRNFHGHCSNKLDDRVPSRAHRSSSTRQCHSMYEITLFVPRSRTSIQQKSFSPRMVCCWNSLLCSVFPSKYNFEQFKRDVNRFLKRFD